MTRVSIATLSLIAGLLFLGPAAAPDPSPGPDRRDPASLRFSVYTLDEDFIDAGQARVDLIGRFAVSLAVDGIGRLLIGGLTQTKNCPLGFVIPVLDVVDAVFALNLKIFLMSGRQFLPGQAFHIPMNIHKKWHSQVPFVQYCSQLYRVIWIKTTQQVLLIPNYTQEWSGYLAIESVFVWAKNQPRSPYII